MADTEHLQGWALDRDGWRSMTLQSSQAMQRRIKRRKPYVLVICLVFCTVIVYSEMHKYSWIYWNVSCVVSSVCQRCPVIFSFAFMQEWCSGWSLLQSLRVQHSLRCITGSNSWCSVLSTVPETQQRENRLPPWGKWNYLKLEGETVKYFFPHTEVVLLQGMLRFLKQGEIFCTNFKKVD